jgi:hypothetical protein
MIVFGFLHDIRVVVTPNLHMPALLLAPLSSSLLGELGHTWRETWLIARLSGRLRLSGSQSIHRIAGVSNIACDERILSLIPRNNRVMMLRYYECVLKQPLDYRAFGEGNSGCQRKNIHDCETSTWHFFCAVIPSHASRTAKLTHGSQ